MKVDVLGMWCLGCAKYATNDDKVSKGIMQVNVKDAQSTS
jgi:hypothetical protein